MIFRKHDRKHIHSNLKRRVLSSLYDKVDNLYVNIIDLHDDDPRTPSVVDTFADEMKNRYLTLSTFKDMCKDLAEGQNGHYDVSVSTSTGEYSAHFYTDEELDEELDYPDGLSTGVVTFSLELRFDNEVKELLED